MPSCQKTGRFRIAGGLVKQVECLRWDDYSRRAGRKPYEAAFSRASVVITLTQRREDAETQRRTRGWLAKAGDRVVASCRMMVAIHGRFLRGPTMKLPVSTFVLLLV